jgi:hypothetical protein
LPPAHFEKAPFRDALFEFAGDDSRAYFDLRRRVDLPHSEFRQENAGDNGQTKGKITTGESFRI